MLHTITVGSALCHEMMTSMVPPFRPPNQDVDADAVVLDIHGPEPCLEPMQVHMPRRWCALAVLFCLQLPS